MKTEYLTFKDLEALSYVHNIKMMMKLILGQQATCFKQKIAGKQDAVQILLFLLMEQLLTKLVDFLLNHSCLLLEYSSRIENNTYGLEKSGFH